MAQMGVAVDVEELVVREGVDRLAEAGYGERCGENCLKLEAWEALYLMSRGKIVLVEGGRQLGLGEAVEILSRRVGDLWLRFTVYSNLRDRGYIVKRGFVENEVEFRVYERGDRPGVRPAKYIVRAVEEGRSMGVEELVELLSYARRLRKELVLAIVDSNGGVTYYSASKVEV